MNTTLELFEAQQRLHSAQQAELQRKQAQTAPQREIEQAQQEVERLAKQQRAEQFEHYSRQNDAAIETVYAVHANLLAALETGDIATARSLADEARHAHEEHVRQFELAMGSIWADIEADAQQRLAATAVRTPVTDGECWHTAAWAYEQRLHHAYGSKHAIMAWINHAPDGLPRQIRVGFAYALTGTWLDPVRDYDPLRAYTTERRAQRRP